MGIDLDELERRLRALCPCEIPEDEIAELVALARKGQLLDDYRSLLGKYEAAVIQASARAEAAETEVARLQRFDAKASDYVESLEKRAELYEQTLRHMGDHVGCQPCLSAAELRGWKIGHQCCVSIAREALEKGAACSDHRWMKEDKMK